MPRRGVGVRHWRQGRHLRVLGGWVAQCAWLCGAALGCALAGCASVPDRVAVPALLSTDAIVPGLADVRVWGDAHFSHALLQAELPRLKAKYEIRESAQKGGPNPPVSNLLAISGGADDGAFGAGLLVG